LNTEQKEAVEHTGGPILVVAGAGTGKTRVITERIKWLVENDVLPERGGSGFPALGSGRLFSSASSPRTEPRGIRGFENKKARPSEILALTFTEKAAGEMLDRVDVAMPLGYEEPWLSTFHSFAERILRDEGLEIGLDPSYKILTPPQAWLFVRQNLFKFDLKHYRPLGNPTKFISAMLTLFSRAQDEDVNPKDYLACMEVLKNPKYETPASPAGRRNSKQIQNSKSQIPNRADEEEIEKQIELANAYQTYQNLKIKNSFMDFGDLISWTLKLFRERPSVLKKYQKQFKYILVDEFQDTNYAQYQLIKLLAPSQNNPELMVTGDDDQSIYKFRGASVSNILEFKKDYPNASTVVLTKNYRSGQKILDAAYRLIQNNNPDRLEGKLGIGKRLERMRNKESRMKDEGPGIIHAATGEEEAEAVVAKIVNRKSQIADLNWKDFAILARANNHLDPFVAALKRHGVPYQLIGNRGLFDQEEVRDVVAVLEVLADPEDDVSFYRLLNIDVLKIEPQKIANFLNQARRTKKSLFEILRDKNEEIISLIERHRQNIAKKPVTLLAFNFLNEVGYVKPLLEEESIENQLKIKNLNLFFDKIKEFESQAPEPNVVEFVNYLDLLIEAGESPAQAEIEDIDTVNLLTVHGAKGLEFPVVFLVNLVSDRFPTRDRKDLLPLPDALVKEILPEGNAHLQEERRLFYVGCTRAKERLFLSWADNYGGTRQKKPSGFIEELGMMNKESRMKERGVEPLTLFSYQPQTAVTKSIHDRVPSLYRTGGLKFVSYSQLEAFSQCPLKYKYRYILGIPTPPSHILSFGQTIHRTLRDFHREDLFKSQTDLNRLLELYQRHWLPEGYESKQHQQERFEVGQEVLKKYFAEHKNLLAQPIHLEKKFTLRIGPTQLIGSIDRVDKLPDGGFEVIDYKTGQVKDQKYVDRDAQLSIYALAAREALGIVPQSLALYFVEENKKVTTTRTGEQLSKKSEEIQKQIEEIKKSDFAPKVSMLCQWCSYKNLCPVYKRGVL